MSSIGSGLIKINKTWTELKAVVASKKILLQYNQFTNLYEIFALDNIIIYVTIIFTGSVPDSNYNQAQNDIDKADFETNYKNITTNFVISQTVVSSGGLTANTNPMLIAGDDGTNLRNLRVFDVDSGGGTQYVLGVGLRKTASGGSVELGTSSDPIRIDPTGTTTQPISAATLPLPSGAATETSLAKLTISQSTALGSNTQALIGGSVTTAAPSYTTGNINPLSLTTAGALRTDSSATTQPVSGTVTVTQSTAANLLANVGGLGASAAAVSGNPVRIAGSDGTNTRDLSSDTSGRLNVIGNANQTSSNFPNPKNTSTGTASLSIDSIGRLETNSTISTSKRGIRDDFPGSGLTTSLTGTVTFNNNSTAITGSSTLFTTEVKIGDYIKKTADVDTAYVLVKSVNSDTSITLDSAYGGTTASTTAVVSNWIPVTGTGGTLSVSTSNFTIASGTTNGSVSSLFRADTFGAGILKFNTSLSQRIVNQEFRIGFQDVATITPNRSAVFRFTGTTNTQVDCISASSSAAADITTTTVIIPNANTSASVHEYKIDISFNQVTFSIDGIKVATHAQHIPNPYDMLNLVIVSANTGVPAGTTSIVTDLVTFKSVNRVQVDNDFTGEPLNTTNLDILRNTYSASVTGLVAANTPTDIFTISGSATRTIKITRIFFSGIQNAAAQRDVLFIKRSAANTGGTSAAVTAIPYDSINAAATATVLSYTANPSGLGAAVGTVLVKKVFIGTSASASDTYITEYGIRNNQPIVLRGTAQLLAINLNSVTSATNSLNISIEWVEE